MRQDTLDDSVREPLRVSDDADYSVFQDGRDEWNGILQNRSRSSIFLRPEWFDAAWQWRKQTDSLRILTTLRDRELVAIAPLSARMLRARLISYIELSLLNVPDSQECDIVVSDKDGAAAISSIIGFLAGRSDWDVAVFPKLRQDSCIHRHAPRACDEAQLRFALRDAGDNPGVELTGDWDSYYSSRSRRLKKGNNNSRNRIYAADKNARVHWSVQADSDAANTESMLEIVRHVSSISWKNATDSSLDNDGPRAFINRLSEHAIANDWLSIWALEINSTFAATEYQLIYEGVVVALRADHDPQFANLSPGSYLNWKIIETLFDSGNQLYHMGPGDNPYKLRWANEWTPLSECRLYNTTLRGSYMWLFEQKVIPLLRASSKLIKKAARAFQSVYAKTFK